MAAHKRLLKSCARCAMSLRQTVRKQEGSSCQVCRAEPLPLSPAWHIGFDSLMQAYQQISHGHNLASIQSNGHGCLVVIAMWRPSVRVLSGA